MAHPVISDTPPSRLMPEELQLFSSRIVRGLTDRPLEISAQQHREEVAELLRQLGEATFYHLLGIDPGSSARDVHDAYERVARRVHPSHARRLGLQGKEGVAPSRAGTSTRFMSIVRPLMRPWPKAITRFLVALVGSSAGITRNRLGIMIGRRLVAVYCSDRRSRVAVQSFGRVAARSDRTAASATPRGCPGAPVPRTRTSTRSLFAIRISFTSIGLSNSPPSLPT